MFKMSGLFITKYHSDYHISKKQYIDKYQIIYCIKKEKTKHIKQNTSAPHNPTIAYRLCNSSNTSSMLLLPISSKHNVLETASKWLRIYFLVFCRNAVAECISEAWNIAAAFSTVIDCNILFSHIVLRRGIQNKSAASNNSIALSNGIRS